MSTYTLCISVSN